MSKQSKLWMEQMTLPEKAAILSGKNVWETREIKRLGIPSITLSSKAEYSGRPFGNARIDEGHLFSDGGNDGEQLG